MHDFDETIDFKHNSGGWTTSSGSGSSSGGSGSSSLQSSVESNPLSVGSKDAVAAATVAENTDGVA